MATQTPPAPPPPATQPPAPTPPDYSLGRYLREGVEVFTNADSRLLRSFRALLARPGVLTRDYFSSQRDAYLRPLQIFVICNVIYFFVQPLIRWNTLTSPLNVHLSQVPYSPLARSMVEAEVARRGVSLDEYRVLFDATIQAHAKTLVIVMVPLFALLAALVFARTRRYFVEHLVFATHFIAFFILTLPLVLVTMPRLGRGLVALGVPAELAENAIDVLITLVLLAVYLYFAIRAAYGSGRLGAGVRAAVLAFTLFFVLQAYRAVLFLTTFYSV